jgi:hypothetical protein
MLEQLYPVGALRTRMEIRTYPRDDETFRAAVLLAIRRFDRIRDMSAIPGRLERHIAEEFPYARARYQDALASTSGTPVMYAFRDGALVAALETQGEASNRSEGAAAAVGSGG